MFLLNLKIILEHNSKFFIRNISTNINHHEREKINNINISKYFNRFLSRTLHFSSQYSIVEYQKNSENNIFQCVTINEKFNYQNIFVKQNIGILQNSKNFNSMHQIKRCFSDSAVDIAAQSVISNSFIGKSERLLLLLSDSVPVRYCQDSLLSLHDSTGLPWWATIILVTSVARIFVTLPVSLYQQCIMAKLVNLKYDMDEIVEDLKKETNLAVVTYGWTEAQARSIYNRSLKKQWNKLIIRDNCHPMKTLALVIVQIPLWIILSASFRNLCYMLPKPTQAGYETFLQLSVEGFGWVSNLTTTDTYWILPLLLGVINLTNIEIQSLMKPKQPTRLQSIGINIFRGLSILMVPVAGVVPTCMSLYWVTSSAYGLVQSFIIVSPRIRRFVRIPETELELEHPYRHLYDNIKTKYFQINKKKLA